MRVRVDIAAWEGMAIYGIGLIIGFAIGFIVRWSMEKPAVDCSDFLTSGETTC